MGFLKSLFNIKKDINPEKNLPSDNDTALPRNIDKFQAEHIKVLRRLDRHPLKEPFSGIMTLEVDIPKFIPILLELKLIELSSYEVSLSLLKNDSLKAILKAAGLKVSGNKNELIQRILNNISADVVKQSDPYSDYYLVTEQGKKVISSFYSHQESNVQLYRNNIIGMIESGDISNAYKVICKHNAEMPIPPGLGMDWNKCCQKGISPSQLQLYSQQLNSSNNRHATAAAIYYDISGDSIQTHVVSNCDTKNDDIAFQNKILHAKREKQSYKECGVKKYRYLATLDSRTCPICGNLDGKVFAVSEMKIGVNCPPMHPECRCTTVAAIEGQALEGKERRARDPVTGKTYLVPASMNYQEWYQSLSKIENKNTQRRK